MLSASAFGWEEIVFRRFALPFLSYILLALIGGALCMSAAVALELPAGWLGVAAAVAVGSVIALRFANEAVVVRGGDIVFRRGALRLSEHVVPIWEPDIEIVQGPLARLFDYGTVRCQRRGRLLELRTVASVRALRVIIAERRRLNALPLSDQLVRLRGQAPLATPPRAPRSQRREVVLHDEGRS